MTKPKAHPRVSLLNLYIQSGRTVPLTRKILWHVLPPLAWMGPASSSLSAQAIRFSILSLKRWSFQMTSIYEKCGMLLKLTWGFAGGRTRRSFPSRLPAEVGSQWHYIIGHWCVYKCEWICDGFTLERSGEEAIFCEFWGTLLSKKIYRLKEDQALSLFLELV